MNKLTILIISILSASVITGCVTTTNSPDMVKINSKDVNSEKVCVYRDKLYTKGAIIGLKNDSIICEKDTDGDIFSDNLKWKSMKQKGAASLTNKRLNSKLIEN